MEKNPGISAAKNLLMRERYKEKQQLTVVIDFHTLARL